MSFEGIRVEINYGAESSHKKITAVTNKCCLNASVQIEQ